MTALEQTRLAVKAIGFVPSVPGHIWAIEERRPGHFFCVAYVSDEGRGGFPVNEALSMDESMAQAQAESGHHHIQWWGLP